MPFSIDCRASLVNDWSGLGPPTDAAAICAATPTLIDFSGSTLGPLVGCRQFGFEQRIPTRCARTSFVFRVKSSRGMLVRLLQRDVSVTFEKFLPRDCSRSHIAEQYRVKLHAVGVV